MFEVDIATTAATIADVDFGANKITYLPKHQRIYLAHFHASSLGKCSLQTEHCTVEKGQLNWAGLGWISLNV